jgi:hypothetical protein
MSSITTLSPPHLRRAADLQERILELQNQSQEIMGAPAQTDATICEGPKKRKKCSAAARAKLRKAQRERWARIRVEKRAHQAS